MCNLPNGTCSLQENKQDCSKNCKNCPAWSPEFDDLYEVILNKDDYEVNMNQLAAHEPDPGF